MPQAKSSTSSSALLALALLLGSCAGSPSSQPTSPVVGAVIEVKSAAGLNVESFRLRAQNGQQLDLRVGLLDLSAGAFPPAHLREHQATSQLVRVTFHQEGSVLVATRLEDA